MSGKILDQRHLLFSEGLHLPAVDDDGADYFAILEHRHTQDGSGARQIDRRHAQLVIMCRLGRHVGNFIRLPCLREPADSDPCIGTERTRAAKIFDIGGRGTVGRINSKRFAIVEPEIAKLGTTDSNGILQHGGEHRLRVAGRRTDEAQHLRDRRALFTRVLNFSRLALKPFL